MPASPAPAGAPVCPFCSLLCDDVIVGRGGDGEPRIQKNGCSRAERGFAATVGPTRPHVQGKPVNRDDAVAAAARILRSARQPLIGGMAADVSGCRAALALAERCGAAVDHAHGEAMMQNLRVLQSKGWFLTTLAELKNRADVVMLVGTNAVEQFPRFFERLIWNQASLVGLESNDRHIVYLGDPSDTSAGVAPGGRKPAVIRCPSGDLHQALGLLRSLLRGAMPVPGRPRSRTAALQRLCKVLKGARYGVIVWSPGELGAEHADLVVRAISELITELNAKTRFAGLVLGGNDGGMTFQNVSAWQSGFPLRVNYASGAPVHDPLLFGTRRMLEQDAADALLWLNSLNADLAPPASRAPLIALVRPSDRLAREAGVYIPVATPGLHHPGTLLRTDSVISLPVRAVHPSELPAAADVLSAIQSRL